PSNGIPFAYDIAQMPFNPTTGKRTNIYHGNGSFLTTQSKNPDATWKWLRTIFSQDAQQVITNFWGTRGAHRGTYDSWLKSFGNGGPPGINVQAIVKADADTYPFPTTPYLTPQALLEPTMRVMYDNVFQNKQKVADGLAQIDKETKALLEKGKAELPKQRLVGPRRRSDEEPRPRRRAPAPLVASTDELRRCATNDKGGLAWRRPQRRSPPQRAATSASASS